MAASTTWVSHSGLEYSLVEFEEQNYTYIWVPEFSRKTNYLDPEHVADIAAVPNRITTVPSKAGVALIDLVDLYENNCAEVAMNEGQEEVEKLTRKIEEEKAELTAAKLRIKEVKVQICNLTDDVEAAAKSVHESEQLLPQKRAQCRKASDEWSSLATVANAAKGARKSLQTENQALDYALKVLKGAAIYPSFMNDSDLPMPAIPGAWGDPQVMGIRNPFGPEAIGDRREEPMGMMRPSNPGAHSILLGTDYGPRARLREQRDWHTNQALLGLTRRYRYNIA